MERSNKNAHSGFSSRSVRDLSEEIERRIANSARAEDDSASEEKKASADNSSSKKMMLALLYDTERHVAYRGRKVYFTKVGRVPSHAFLMEIQEDS